MQDERSEETYASSSKRKKFVSKVWNDFKKVKKDGKDKAVCLHCQKEFVGSSKSGTTHLKNHLSRCPVTKDGETQKKMITTCLETGVGEDFVFDNERSHLDMARMILKHGYSLDMIEHEFFQIFVKNLQPRFKPYSQDTLKADILHVYKEEKEKLYKYLGTLSCHFSLMIQFWTCHRKNNAYCCFALQFLEDGLILKKKILALKKLDQCNDIEARTLFGIVISLLQEWNIDKKLCSVTLRSSCSNDKMVQDLGIWLRNRAFQLPIYGYFFHIHCTTDIINLLFQDGLNEMAGMLHKVRNAVRYVNEATLRCKLDFKYTLEQHNFQGKYSTRFEDVSTRWDSTFLKLESALELKELFSLLEDLDDGDYDMLNSSWCEKIRCNKVASRSELDRYLAAPRILVNGDFDILSWWRTNSSEFPILGKMALDILPIPMSTCALISSYSSFSIDATTTVINPAFNDFDPDIIEALVCGEDWLDKSTKKAPNKEDKHCSGYTFNGEPTDHDHASMALVVPFSSSKPDQEKSDSANIRLVFTSPNSKYIVEDLIFGEDWLDKSTKKAPNKDDKHSSSCSLNGGSTDHDHTSMALIAPSLSNSELDQEKPDSANTKLIASPNSIDITDALIFGDDWLVKDTKKAPNNEHEHSSGYTFNREPIDHDCTSMALFSHSLRCSQSDKEKSDSPFAANTTIVHASPNTSIPAPKIICPQNLSITIPQQPLCPHAFHSPTRAPLGESFVNDRHSIEKAKLLKHLFGD